MAATGIVRFRRRRAAHAASDGIRGAGTARAAAHGLRPGGPAEHRAPTAIANVRYGELDCIYQPTLARTRAVGEPIITGIDPGPLGAELAATGWTLVEHLDSAEIQRGYFATRTDGYRASPVVHLACAGVV